MILGDFGKNSYLRKVIHSRRVKSGSANYTLVQFFFDSKISLNEIFVVCIEINKYLTNKYIPTSIKYQEFESKFLYL